MSEREVDGQASSTTTTVVGCRSRGCGEVRGWVGGRRKKNQAGSQGTDERQLLWSEGLSFLFVLALLVSCIIVASCTPFPAPSPAPFWERGKRQTWRVVLSAPTTRPGLCLSSWPLTEGMREWPKRKPLVLQPHWVTSKY